MNSWWKVDGAWITFRDDRLHCLVGQAAARQFGLAPGVKLICAPANAVFRSPPAESSRRVAPRIVKLSRASISPESCGFARPRESVQLSVSGTPAEIETFTSHLATALPGLEVRPVRQLAPLKIDSGAD